MSSAKYPIPQRFPVDKMRKPTSISDLPNELILKILTFDLSLSDLQYVRLQSRRFRANAEAALEILYRREARAATVINNPTSNVSTMERIARLRRREVNFENFWCSEIEIDNINRSCGGISASDIMDLNNGFLLVGSPGGGKTWATSISYIHLPSFDATESTGWQPVPFRCDPREMIRAFQLVDALDLLVIVTSDPNPQGGHNLTVYLRSFSTGVVHPSATMPRIKWTMENGLFRYSTHRNVKLLVVGDYIGLLLTLDLQPMIDSRFFLLDWKTGHHKMVMPVTSNNYEDFIFLAKDVVLFTDPERNRLDICYIEESPHNQPKQFSVWRYLLLPALNKDAKTDIEGFYCNSYPLDNCAAISNAHALMPPFESSSRDSIIVFNIAYGLKTPSTGGDYASFRIVTHRQTLLDLLSPSATLTGTSDGGFAWSAWGPPRTRWFAATEDQDACKQVMSGQRYVSVARQEFADDFPIAIYDFNPQNISRSDDAETSRERMIYEEPGRRHDVQPFAEEVWSELPYVGIEWPTSYEGMEHVMMDDERIIIFPTNPLNTRYNLNLLNLNDEANTSPGEILDIKVLLMTSCDLE